MNVEGKIVSAFCEWINKTISHLNIHDYIDKADSKA